MFVLRSKYNRLKLRLSLVEKELTVAKRNGTRWRNALDREEDNNLRLVSKNIVAEEALADARSRAALLEENILVSAKKVKLSNNRVLGLAYGPTTKKGN